MIYYLSIFLSICLTASCTTVASTFSTTKADTNTIVVGAAQLDQLLPQLENKTVALLVNQTSTIGATHLVDTLLHHDIRIQTIFAPEHGFRGTADAGAKIKDGKDAKTGLPIRSLYGKKRKPSPADLAGINLILFDIQDVGARFYTYISSMHYMMEACAEQGVKFIVLDRPNPNGHYVDGPILDTAYQSFVGMHPVPIVHGMTVGEYAEMINGEGWLANGVQCDLAVIPCQNYDHNTFYELPIKPSPNLPNARSIYLYPSLCFFEGTPFSAGRGTNTQFQIFGHPDFTLGNYEFTPQSMPGAKYPKHEEKVCKGINLTTLPIQDLQQQKQLDLSYLLLAYQGFEKKEDFFNSFFKLLAGGETLQAQIEVGRSEEEIRASWQTGLDTFRQVRAKYLIYD